jgi:hypothetical protein
MVVQMAAVAEAWMRVVGMHLPVGSMSQVRVPGAIAGAGASCQVPVARSQVPLW